MKIFVSILALVLLKMNSSGEEMSTPLVYVDNVVTMNPDVGQEETEKEKEIDALIIWCIFVGLFAIVIIAVIICCYLDKNSIYHTNKHKCCKKEKKMKTALEGGQSPLLTPSAPKETVNPKSEEKSMKFEPPFPNRYPGERTKEGKPCSVSLAVGSPGRVKSFHVAPLKKTSQLSKNVGKTEGKISLHRPFTDRDTDYDSALASPKTSKIKN